MKIFCKLLCAYTVKAPISDQIRGFFLWSQGESSCLFAIYAQFWLPNLARAISRSQVLAKFVSKVRSKIQQLIAGKFWALRAILAAQKPENMRVLRILQAFGNKSSQSPQFKKGFVYATLHETY